MQKSSLRPTWAWLVPTLVLALLVLLASHQPMVRTDVASERVIDARIKAFIEAVHRWVAAPPSLGAPAGVRG